LSPGKQLVAGAARKEVKEERNKAETNKGDSSASSRVGSGTGNRHMRPVTLKV
jgi:hypothetical protein